MPGEVKSIKTRVAKVIDEYTIVINKGLDDGIKPGQRFLIFAFGENIIDPDTKEDLGTLEIVRGTGKVTHLQEKIATVTSDMKSSPRKTIRKIGKPGTLTGMAVYYASMFGSEEVEEHLPAETVPFEEATIGDYAKPI